MFEHLLFEPFGFFHWVASIKQYSCDDAKTVAEVFMYHWRAATRQELCVENGLNNEVIFRCESQIFDRLQSLSVFSEDVLQVQLWKSFCSYMHASSDLGPLNTWKVKSFTTCKHADTILDRLIEIPGVVLFFLSKTTVGSPVRCCTVERLGIV